MTPSESNSYSPRWFECFHVGIAEERTRQETDFICACAPLPRFRDVLDVCCGMGRHARALASRGYHVTGVERDLAAIAKAREQAGGPSYIEADARHFEPDPAAYDLVVVMSQSFGHFDAATNRKLLARLATGLRPGGRLVLDLWNGEFFVAHQGAREFVLRNGTVRETKHVENGRLFVQLEYPDGAHEGFEWQLFTPREIAALSDKLRLIASCTDFDLATPPHAGKPRLQVVLERSA